MLLLSWSKSTGESRRINPKIKHNWFRFWLKQIVILYFSLFRNSSMIIPWNSNLFTFGNVNEIAYSVFTSKALNVALKQLKQKIVYQNYLYLSGIIAEHVSTLVLYELEIDSISMIAQSFTLFTSPVIVWRMGSFIDFPPSLPAKSLMF